MENSLLITSSLLDALEWIKICPPSWKTRARASMISTLRREPYTTSPEAQQGIDFEDEVCDICIGESTSKFANPVVMQVVSACKGGNFQHVVKKLVMVAGNNVRLYCKLDVKLPEKIIDIKTTASWRGKQKYLNGWQHVLYCYVADVEKFEYHVAVFDRERPVVRYIAPYLAKSNASAEITRAILELFAWLKDESLWDDYVNIYSKPKRKNNG